MMRFDPWRRRRVIRAAAVFWTPVFVVFVLLVVESARDFLWVHQFDDWWSQRQSFQRVLGLKVLGAVNVLEAQALEPRMNPAAADAAAVRLDVDRQGWDAHATNVAAGFESYMDANILEGNLFHPVKVRFRGDTSVHWLTEKRSFTLRTSRSNLWRGHRRLAFSSKTILEQYVTSRLAEEFELQAPQTWLSPVFLNDRFYGMFRVLEQVDESFLRRRNQLPGNIYRGDAAERGEYFKGLERSLFLNPYIWDRTANNDRPGAPAPDAIASWVRDMNGTTAADHARFMSRLDRTEIANLLAVMLLTGDLFHMSGIHNQFWYEDPVMGMLHPIPWDIELRELRRPPHRVNRFLRAVFRDPVVFDEALRILHAKLMDDQLLDRAVAMTREAYERHRVYFDYDELRAGAVSRVGTPDEIVPSRANADAPDRLRDNIALLGEWFADARAGYCAQATDDGAIILDVVSRGYAGTRFNGVLIESAGAASGAWTLIADRNRNGMIDDGDARLACRMEHADGGIGFMLDEPVVLLSGVDSREPLIKPEPLDYRFLLIHDGGATDSAITVRPILENRITGKPVAASEQPAGEPIEAVTSIHPWDMPEPATGEVRLAGDVHLTETLMIDAGQTLVIEPGARIRLDPDVSVVSRGRVIAAGTDDSPIAFDTTQDRRPWGTLALVGEGASGSRFSHCVIEHGGGALVGRIEFKGMVCVHKARRVMFEACTFRENLRCDDTINVVSADASIVCCRFERANADSIDFDLSTGRIESCEIIHSGNDGIDLMTCSPRIVNNRIVDSDDKGISIGESATPIVMGNVISGCERGVEVKDSSAPLLAFNRIEGNRVGVLQAAKNWRYGGGGRAKFVGGAITGNDVDLRQDQVSVVTFSRAKLGAESIGWTDEEAADWRGPLAAVGMDCVDFAADACDVWAESAALDMILHDRYDEDFEDLYDGWSGWSDLRKQNGALVVRTRGRDVTISKILDIECASPATLILEFASRGLGEIRIAAIGEQAVTRHLQGTGDLSRARYAVLSLPAGGYDRIELTLSGDSRDGRLDLHDLRVAAVAIDDQQATVTARR